MTARDKILRQCRQALALCLSGLGVFLGSVALMVLLAAMLPDEPIQHVGQGPKVFWTTAVLIGGLLAGFVVALSGLLRLWMTSRCPWCRGDWYAFVVSIAQGTVRYCPHCERPVDGKLPAIGPHGKPTSRGDWGEDEMA